MFLLNDLLGNSPRFHIGVGGITDKYLIFVRFGPTLEKHWLKGFEAANGGVLGNNCIFSDDQLFKKLKVQKNYYLQQIDFSWEIIYIPRTPLILQGEKIIAIIRTPLFP